MPQWSRKEYQKEYTSYIEMRRRLRKKGLDFHPSLKSFCQFMEHLGPKPDESYTLDRIDPSDPQYAAGKVRWATKREQSNNRRTTLKLTYHGQQYTEYFGKTLPITEWSRITGQKPETLRQRKRNGWPDTEIIDGERERQQKTFRQMSKSELLYYQPWPEDMKAECEKRYIDFCKREPEIDRFEFLLFVLHPEWNEVAYWEMKDVAWNSNIKISKYNLRPGERQVGHWIKLPDVDDLEFENRLKVGRSLSKKRKLDEEEYKKWKSALRLRLQEEGKHRSARNIENRYRREFNLKEGRNDLEETNDYD